MNRYCRSENDEEESEDRMLGDEYGAIRQCNPHHRDGYDLDFQWYRLVSHKVPDIRAESGMIKQPVIQILIATKKESRSQKQQRSRRKDRKEYSQNTQSQGKKP